MTREYDNLGTERQCWIIIDREEVPEGVTLNRLGMEFYMQVQKWDF